MSKIRAIQRILRFLGKKERIGAAFLLILMCVCAFVEIGSVSFIMVLVSLLTNKESVIDTEWYKLITNTFRKNDDSFLIVFFIVCIVLIYTAKMVLNLLLNYYQYKFIFVNQNRTQQKYLQNYYSKKYEYFAQNSTAKILRIVSTDIPYMYAMLNTFFSLCTELIICFFLLVYLLYVSWLATLIIIFAVMSLSLGIYLIFRNKLIVAGEGYKEGLEKLNKWIMQGIDNIKEIKAMRREGFILQKSEKYGYQYAESTRKRLFYTAAPKPIIEGTIVVVLMLVLAVYIYIDQSGFLSLIPLITALLVASIRLLPSASRINSYINDMNYMLPFLDSMNETILEKQNGLSTDESIVFNEKKEVVDFHSIRFENLFFRYSEAEKWIFNDAAFEIKKGDTVGIVGESGGGKTTFVDLLIGLLTPESGNMFIDNKKVDHDYMLGSVGYIPQKVELIDGTIRENIAFGIPSDEVDDDKIKKLIKDVRLEEFISELPDGVDTKVGERGSRLSGGQCQRIGIARALYANASLLVFDEATSALDNDTEYYIIESINSMKGKITMIIIAHRLETIKNCDYVYEVKDGKIILK